MEVLNFKSGRDIKETLNNIESEIEKLDCVMIVGLYKDGGQILEVSKSSGYEKTFMVQFANAWINNWFRLKD